MKKIPVLALCGLTVLGSSLAEEPCKGPDGDGSSSGGGTVAQSCDPNEISGPLGMGEKRYVPQGEWMDYTIYFENKTNATAAAQEVFVDLPMDANLDWSTLELGEIAFGDHIDTSLVGKSHGKASYALPGTNTSVKTEVKMKDGVLSWYIRDWDPTTTDNFPASATGGFLPPNDPETHCGEGHLSFRVRVKPGAPDGAVIAASATIVFDSNAPIETDPSWWNTVGTIHDVKLEIDGVATNVTLIAGLPFGALPAPKTPRPGYTFDGWFTGPNGTGLKATPAAIVPVGDFVLYQNWVGVPYRVRFNANGGTGTMADQTFMYGTAQKLPANAFTRKMHVFTGWGLTPGGAAVFADGQNVQNLTESANDVVTLYAVWEKSQPLLWEDISDAAPLTAASVYFGYLYDNGGNPKGTIQVKVGKANAKTGLAAVKATVVGLDGKKKSLKAAEKGKAVIAMDGPTAIALIGGEACEVVIGKNGLSGVYGAYTIDGSRNFFSSKDKAEQNAANAALNAWKGTFNVAWRRVEDNAPYLTMSVTIAAKGKVKIAATLANGLKASASVQALVGEAWLCVPVVITKKVQMAFALWLPRGGGEISVEGLDGKVVAGKAGALKSGAKFHIDAEAFSAKRGQAVLPYLPDGVAVTQSGTRWTLPKAGKVQMAKDGTVDAAKLGDNPAALKLSYKAKDGSFKGSFKAYSLVNGKPKAVTVNVAGVVIDGVAYGSATIGKSGQVAVEIR